MRKHHTVSTGTVTGLLLGGLAVAGTLSAFGSAPSAAAGCISAFGLGNGTDCSSTVASIAVAVGPGAQAHADGLLGAAFAFGTNSLAFVFSDAGGNLAIAVGENAKSLAGGAGSVGLAAGKGLLVQAGTSTTSIANIVVSLGNGKSSVTSAFGIGNVAVNLFGDLFVSANGNLNTAVNVGGSNTAVSASGNLNAATNLFGTNNRVVVNRPATISWAFNAFGGNNSVTAGPGPLAVAGSIAQTGMTITRAAPGININGFTIGGAGSVSKATTGTPAAARPARRTP